MVRAVGTIGLFLDLYELADFMNLLPLPKLHIRSTQPLRVYGPKGFSHFTWTKFRGGRQSGDAFAVSAVLLLL
jgi:hypothetical protein